MGCLLSGGGWRNRAVCKPPLAIWKLPAATCRLTNAEMSLTNGEVRSANDERRLTDDAVRPYKRLMVACRSLRGGL
jgi:hypothetical protein